MLVGAAVGEDIAVTEAAAVDLWVKVGLGVGMRVGIGVNVGFDVAVGLGGAGVGLRVRVGEGVGCRFERLTRASAPRAQATIKSTATMKMLRIFARKLVCFRKGDQSRLLEHTNCALRSSLRNMLVSVIQIVESSIRFCDVRGGEVWRSHL